ncbi:CHAT domain-containing protein [Azospirillum sp. HJ39]|uniref:CHAT domain-containing protein n=1 Tax=Azospirillum sp. HJ39 TaxID=3159496 RepID=UPI00355651F4
MRKTALRAMAGSLLIVLTGCGPALFLPDYKLARTGTEREGITSEDFDDIAAGRLGTLRQRLRGIPIERHSVLSIGLLCELELRADALGAADACNREYLKKGGADPAVQAAARRREALLYMARGEYEDAWNMVDSDESDNGVFLSRLLRARSRPESSGDALPPQIEMMARRKQPLPSFFAATVFAETGRCDRTIALLEDPDRRLLADYGLGAQPSSPDAVRPTFRLDLVKAFDGGILGNHSIAPAGNVYIEFLAAKCLFTLNRPTDARRYLDRVLSYPGIDSYGSVHWQSLHLMGRLERQGNPDSAVDRFKRAIDLVEASRASIASDIGRLAFSASTYAVYQDLIALLLERGALSDALEYMERARCRLLVERLIGLPGMRTHDSSGPRVAANQVKLRQSDEFLHLQSSGPEAATAIQAVREASEAIARDAPALALASGVKPPGLREFLPRTGGDEAAIVFFPTAVGTDAPQWHALLIEDGRISSYHKLGASPISLEGFVGTLKNPEDGSYKNSARILYRHFLQPVLSSTQASNLLIVPHGELFAVPFGVLDDGTGPVLQSKRIRIVPSLTALAALRPDDRPLPANGLALGNPTLRNMTREQSLRHAEAEVDMLERLFPKMSGYRISVYKNSNATIEKVLTEGPNTRILHIAAHGKFDSFAPLNSRLLLSDLAGDGDLTVAKLHTAQIPTKLAVLSACVSAIRGDRTDQDLTSIADGFLAAGAQSVVGTLWQVNDSATSVLLEAFYLALRQGNTAAAALGIAQKAMSQRTGYSHPYYWAGFTVIGADVRL